MTEEGKSQTLIKFPSKINGVAVTSIGDYAFCDIINYNFNETMKTLIISEGITSIGTAAIGKCFALINVTLPDSLLSIGDSAFEDCSNLSSISIPVNVNSIGMGAFGFTGLTSVTFENTTGWTVTSVTVDVSNPATAAKLLTSEYVSETWTVDHRARLKPGLYKTGTTTMLYSWNDLIANDIVYFNSGSVSSNFDINTLSNSSANHLAGDLVLPNDGSITEIAYNAFFGCNNLTSVVIPYSVTSIGTSAFCRCSSITSITIPNNVTDIGTEAFYYTNITGTITIPDSVVNIQSAAFAGCPDLTSISVSENNTAYKTVDGILYSKDGTKLICYPAGKTDSSFTVPEGVEVIVHAAFFACKNLESVALPNDISTIEYAAFYNCTNLADVYYSGTEAGWSAIVIDNTYNNNSALVNAKIHYQF